MKHEILSLHQKASFRNLGDEGILLMTDSGQLYSTNAAGTAFVDKIDAKSSFDELVAQVGMEFEVEIDVLRTDLLELAEYLLNEGALELVSDA